MLPFADMNLGDAVEGPASAPGYAPAPQALINAAIAAEEAPTPEEKAVTNPLTNVLSAILTGRRLQETSFEQLNSQPLSVKDAAGVANSAIYESLQEAQQIFNPPAMAPAASAPAPSQVRPDCQTQKLMDSKYAQGQLYAQSQIDKDAGTLPWAIAVKLADTRAVIYGSSA